MIRTFLLEFSVGLCIALAAQELPFSERWKLPETGSVSGQNVLRIDVPAEKKNGSNIAELPIDVEQFRGKILFCRARYRMNGVTRPSKKWNGQKFSLTMVSGRGERSFPGNNGAYGSSDWKELTLTTPIPEDTRSISLCVGLQESSGVIEFKDVACLSGDSFVAPVSFSLPEGFRCEYTEHVRSWPRLRGVMAPEDSKPRDWSDLAKWKVNVVRFQLVRNWGRVRDNRDKAEFRDWLKRRCDKLDGELSACAAHGIRGIVDLHVAPGGRNANGDLAMFYEPEYADEFVRIWEMLARRYRDNPAVLAFDLINEPSQMSPASENYLDLQYRAALAIRRIAPDMPLIVDGSEYGSPLAFQYLKPLPLKDVLYQTHMYAPLRYTHQKSAKVVYPSADITPQTLCDALQPVRNFEKKYGARIYVGEFSAIRWAEGGADYLNDLLTILEEYSWDWSYHAYRESPVWDLELEGPQKGPVVRPATPGKRLQTLLRRWEKNHLFPRL